MKSTLHRYRHIQAGTFAVEFAIVLTLLLTLIFGVIELARIMYLFNTITETTRRAANAAAMTNFRDEAAKDKLRQASIFRTNPGELALGAPINDQYVRIEYLSLAANGDGSFTMTPIPSASLPACPSRNRVICMQNPHDASCIRFVKASICDPADTDTCKKPPYKSLIPLIDLPIHLPSSPTIVPVESLGFVSGASPCL